MRLKNLGALFADRWQIPAAVLAVVAVGFAFSRLRPERREVPFESLLADVLTLADAGRFHDASDAAANLLEMDPPLPPNQRGILHDTLADVLLRAEAARSRPIPGNLESVLEHHAQARRLGAARRPDATLRAALAHEWLGHRWKAIEAFRVVLASDSNAEQRRQALRALVRLLGKTPEEVAQRRQYLEALLAEPDVSVPYLWWSLRHAVSEALERDDLARARDLVGRFGERLLESGLQGFYEYLFARVQFALGDIDQASAALDAASAWLKENPHIDAQIDQAGYLPALVHALRGRLHLADLRPQAALESLDRALTLQGHGEVFLSATLDRVRALAMLERHRRARADLRDAARRLARDPAVWATSLSRLRAVALELADAYRAQSDFDNAIAYLELTLELTEATDQHKRREVLERLAHENETAARSADRDAAAGLHAAAARYFERAAELSISDQTEYAALLWSSATHYDQAGRMDDARRMLRAFVDARRVDPRLPQAMLRLGRVCAAQGALQDALEWYGRLIERFPKLEEATQARLLRANILTALGPEHYDEAERTLQGLLQGELVAPQAQVFRDALAALCDLYVEAHRYAQAISRIESFLGLYPDDPEARRLEFLLADAYRRSARVLPEQPPSDALAQAARIESERRFARAADLFQHVLADLGDKDDANVRLYRRLALLYRADCLYELNRPDTLEEALNLYREAAARYQGHPASLSAHVQIANIYLREGRVKEAATAIERARWQFSTMAPATFEAQRAGLDRATWRQFLESVSGSQLFETAAAAP